MFNPIVAMLHNTKLDRWHPITFREAPLPGPPSADKPIRHKSQGHHTDGFATREEAVVFAKELAVKIKTVVSTDGGAKTCLDEDIPWDGEGVPAISTFFTESEISVVG